MPRLSTILPHQASDAALETSILSVLENRPDDCEIIVVHNGDYADPYHLSDELLLVEKYTANPVALLNAGLAAARAPVVCVMTGGVSVSNQGWATEACRLLSYNSDVTSLAVNIHGKSDDQLEMGIALAAVTDSTILQSGRIDQRRPGPTAGPQLGCGFYRRRALLALGGWNESVSWDNADIELAMLMNQLGMCCELLDDCEVQLTESHRRSQSNTNIKQLAELAVAYELCTSGATSAMTDLLRGCLSGNISASVAWATGVMAARAKEQVQHRLKTARDRWQQLQQRSAVQPIANSNLRRAA